MSEYTDSMELMGVPLTIEWSIDVDSPQIDSVSVDDGCGDDIQGLLSREVIRTIEGFLHKRMDKMGQEARDERAIANWENAQYWKNA